MDIPYTFATSENPVHISAPSDSHGLKDFGVGDTFRAPSISLDANRWNSTSDIYKNYQAKIAAITPTRDQLDGISNSNSFDFENFASANITTDRSQNLNLSNGCSQNFNNLSAGVGLASSLLPTPPVSQDNSCDINKLNPLANQVFLSAAGQIGYASSGPLRNQSYDLRSVPPNPMQNVGPFMNSTIAPDLLRRPLEDSAPSFGLYGTGLNNPTTPMH